MNGLEGLPPLQKQDPRATISSQALGKHRTCGTCSAMMKSYMASRSSFQSDPEARDWHEWIKSFRLRMDQAVESNSIEYPV